MRVVPPLVAISAGRSSDLARLGYWEEHVNETLVHVARLVFHHGLRLGYGGKLEPSFDTSTSERANFTRTLIDTVVGYASRSTLAEPRAERVSPLVSYQVWPDHRVPRSLEATLIDVCQFVQVEPAWTNTVASRTDPGSLDPAERAYWIARAMSEMRLKMAAGTRDVPGAALWICLAGKVTNFSGVMPGVAEEYLLARRHGKPVLVFGTFGGCASKMAEFLTTPDAPLPLELTLDYFRTRPEYAPIHAHADELALPALFDELRDTLTRDRARLHSSSPLVPGLSNEELHLAMTADSSGLLTSCIARVLAVLEGGANDGS